MNRLRLIAVLCLWTYIAAAEGQTQVDLRTQGKDVDFTAAGSTKPMQTGSSLPATCAVGQFFFLTTAPAGNNIYACNPANTWTAQGASLSVTSGSANEVLSSNGSTTQWLALGGDISGAPGGLTVNRLQGHPVSGTAPAAGQVLQWNATANQWQPAAAQTGNATYAFASQLSITIPGTVHQFGTANLVVDCYDNSTPPQRVEPDKVQISPTNYNVSVYFSNAQTGYCVVNGAGSAAISPSGGAVSVVFGRSGAIQAQAGDYNFSQISGTAAASQLPSASGDVSGPLSGVTVTGLQNRAVANTAPANGQTLVWNSNASTWAPQTILGGGVSSVFGRTGSVTGQSGDYSFGQISGAVSASQLPNSSGDLSGQLTGATVTGLQNRPVSSAAPSNGQALAWNSTQMNWQPTTISGGGGAISSVFGRTGAVTAQSGDYSFSQISGMISSGQLPASGGDVTGSMTSTVVSGLQNRAVANIAPTNGQALVWNSSASAWQPTTVSGGGGAVSSVFGRTGAVTAQSGDYSFGLISGTVASSQLPAAGGDLTGSLTTATVKAIQGQAVSSTPATNGQALVWNSTSSAWLPTTLSGSGGVTMAYQLGDLATVRTSSTVLTIGSGCTPTSPCNVRFGYQVYNITNGATATISSGSGAAYVYVNSAGTLMVGHNLTVACSAGCTQQSGVTAFPPNTVPIYTWTATSGTWDSTGGHDQRAFIGAKVLGAGQGIVLTEAPGLSTLAVDNSVIPTYLMNTASLTYSSIASNACAADQTITVSGANPGDSVAPGWPALPTGVLGTMLVTATNTVTVRLCNMSGAGATPPSTSYKATIVRNY